ncbi:hypothetical protein M885DRAFT_524582 [Pelagophyceae sp. CCMP2097]|nr:hypothetical protein M885DRAFT_524582 [Pelagophyceae sp. CCMP2097]
MACLLIVDAAYVHVGSAKVRRMRNTGGGRDINSWSRDELEAFDPKALLRRVEDLIGRRCTHAVWCGAKDGRMDSGGAALERALRAANFEARFRPMKCEEVFCRNRDCDDSSCKHRKNAVRVVRQAGVDVDLAVRTLEIVYRHGPGAAVVLVAGDGDFAPLADALERARCQLYVAAFEHSLSNELAVCAERSAGLLSLDASFFERKRSSRRRGPERKERFDTTSTSTSEATSEEDAPPREAPTRDAPWHQDKWASPSPGQSTVDDGRGPMAFVPVQVQKRFGSGSAAAGRAAEDRMGRAMEDRMLREEDRLGRAMENLMVEDHKHDPAFERPDPRATPIRRGDALAADRWRRAPAEDRAAPDDVEGSSVYEDRSSGSSASMLDFGALHAPTALTLESNNDEATPRRAAKAKAAKKTRNCLENLRQRKKPDDKRPENTRKSPSPESAAPEAAAPEAVQGSARMTLGLLLAARGSPPVASPPPARVSPPPGPPPAVRGSARWAVGKPRLVIGGENEQHRRTSRERRLAAVDGKET